MTVDEVINLIKADKFTCSDGAQFLAEQPTKDEASHAHMHSLDGFDADLAKIKPASFAAPTGVDAAVLAQSRVDFWKNPEVHLQPKTGGTHTSTVFDPAATTNKFEPYQFYIDETRLATNDTYLKRGMAEIPELNSTTYVQKVIYKEAGQTKPTNKDFQLKSATDKADGLIPTGSTLVKTLPVQAKVEKIHPTYPAMEAHSMFEDSEMLVMAVTASLIGDAGIFALTKLKAGAAGAYIAIFSASAITAVNLAISNFAAKTKKTLDPIKVVERAPGSTSVKTGTGVQPSVQTSGATYTKLDMKRVVAVLKKSVTDELILVTCYPSQQPPPGQNLTPPPTATDDVVELDKNAALYQVIKQATPVSLKWE